MMKKKTQMEFLGWWVFFCLVQLIIESIEQNQAIFIKFQSIALQNPLRLKL